MTYNSWPIGKLPKGFERPELAPVMKQYGLSDPMEVVDKFEKLIAEYAGSKYAVAVDSCTNALFLCLKCRQYHPHIRNGIYYDDTTIPCYTYVSVPSAILQANYEFNFKNIAWAGYYQLRPFEIYDMAVRFTKDMYIGGMCCLSFQIKKRLPIGKGGMILLDDYEAYKWLKKARYEGRDITKPYTEDNIEFMGWNMYMTPEDAARGILLFNQLPEHNDDICDWSHYTDLSKLEVFK